MYESKVMDLRLKDKDNQLRMQWIRQKELNSIIDGFRKLRRAELKKAKQILQLAYQTIED